MTDQTRIETVAMTARIMLTELREYMKCPLCKDCPFGTLLGYNYACDIQDMIETLEMVEGE